MTIKNIREYENAHIVLWLVKDFCWCTGLHLLGMSMVLPTLLVAIDITRRSRQHLSDLWTNIAVCFWICANAIWMTGEFFFNDGFRSYAQVFFVIGLASLALYYLVLRRRQKNIQADVANHVAVVLE